MPLPRRLLKELIAMHRLEQSIRDVFVEGPLDKRVIKGILADAGSGTVSVHSIQDVEISPSLLEKYGLTTGERQRLITLALVCKETLPAGSQSLTCWVDADCEVVLKEIAENAFLLLTDYSCLEGYFWSDGAVGRLLRFHSSSLGGSIPTLLESLNTCVRKIFLLRAAALWKKVPVRWIPFKDFVTLENHRVVLDHERYLQRALIASGLASKAQVLLVAIEALESIVPCDTRYAMNGHDALEMLALCLKGLKVAKPHADDLFFGLFMGADWSSILEQPSIKSLLQRVSV